MPLRAEDKALGSAARYEDVTDHGHYIVIKWKATGAWSCSCTDWIIRRAKLEGHTDRAPAKNHCKHVRRALAGELRPVGATVYVVRGSSERLTGRAAVARDEEV